MLVRLFAYECFSVCVTDNICLSVRQGYEVIILLYEFDLSELNALCHVPYGAATCAAAVQGVTNHAMNANISV